MNTSTLLVLFGRKRKTTRLLFPTADTSIATEYVDVIRGNARDISQNDTTAVTENLTAHKLTTCVDFSPASSFIQLPNTGTLQSNTFSIFMRIVRVQDITAGLTTGDALFSIDFGVNTAGDDRLTLNATGEFGVGASTGTVLPITSVISVGVSHDGVTSKFYINGQLSGTGGGTTFDFNRTLKLGQEAGFGNNFTGKMRDFRMGTAVWTATEFLNMHNDDDMLGTNNPANIHAWLKMNEGTGTSAADATGNSNTGTLTNATWTTM